MTPLCDLFHFLQKVSRLRQMWGRTRITNEQPPGCFRINISVSLTSTLMTTLKPGLFIPQSHAPLSLTTPPFARPLPQSTLRYRRGLRENIELMMDSSHLFHSAQRGLARPLPLLSACFWSEKQPEKGWPALLVTLSAASIDSFPTHLT